jgi:MoxR-like ATPase
MEERRASIDGVTNALPPLFTVFATQNPVEYEGTYPLPEAQLDRFLVKILVDYPDEESERAMLVAWDRGFQAADLTTAQIKAVATVDDLLRARASLPAVRVEQGMIGYILEIVRRTRSHRQLTLGASPRAAVDVPRLTGVEVRRPERIGGWVLREAFPGPPLPLDQRHHRAGNLVLAQALRHGLIDVGTLRRVR